MSEMLAKQEDLDETKKLIRFILHRMDKLETRIRELENEGLLSNLPRTIPERP